MAGNSIGQAFRVTTAGESHGKGNVVIIDGVPPGIELSEEDLIPDMERRRPGQSKITTQRKEPDMPIIMSGVFEGRTTGTSIAVVVNNKDQRSKDYSDISEKYRPGHADFTFDAKYGFRDYRGGGRSSARETTSRVAAGAIARKMLRQYGIEVVGYVTRVGHIEAKVEDPSKITMAQVESNIARCPDPEVAQEMIAFIDSIRKDQDSIGGIAEIVATGVPPGLGEPVFDKLKADIAHHVMSIPAVMGFEFGEGFGVAALRGSENNDLFDMVDGEVVARTNRHGGMLGGITSGSPIVCRAAIKPTSSLSKPQETVDRSGEPTSIRTKGRHDPCLLPRFVPIGEAAVLVALADHFLRWRGQAPEQFQKYMKGKEA